MKQEPLEQLTGPLLTWYGENARTLPWRGAPTAYHVWVSEIMLQQTRVGAVLGYYARFMETFPTVEELAAGDEGRLMKLWEGLGYYSRARNLQKAAKLVVERHGGNFPQSYAELTALPGIGDYTAGAILSIAFGQTIPAVDGNVLRVAARLTASREDVSDARVRRLFRERVAAVVPAGAAGAYNQALMDLGATVCLPNGKPLCQVCPAENFCQGRRQGEPEKLPVKAPKKKRRTEERTVFVLLSPMGVALAQRPETGLLAGLWEFPNVEGALSETEAAAFVRDWGLEIVQWRKKLSTKHIFTHVEWRMSGYVLEVKGRGDASWVWADRVGLETRAVPSAFGRFLEEVEEIWGQ